MEVVPGVHRIEGPLGNRRLFQHLLVGERVVLIDTGCADTPEAMTFPYLRSIGRSVDDVSMAIITHADADHFGGNHSFRKACPRALLLSHEIDRRMASDPAVTMAERYNGFEADHRLTYDQGTRDALAGMMGPAEPIDVGIAGGEVLRLSPSWQVRILHTPGHSLGHLAVYDRENRWAIICDAALGATQVDRDGHWAAPPPYVTRDGYLQTVIMLQSLRIDTLLTSHYPLMRGEEVRTFLAASRDFVCRADEAVLRAFEDAREPIGLIELIERCNPVLGPFDFATDLEYALLAHAQWFETRGVIQSERRDGRTVWRLAHGLA